MTIRLIALDLDGTTLNSENLLTEKTKETLQKTAKSEVVVVPVTGRCFKSLPRELLDVREKAYVKYAITSNGAEIRDMKTKDILYSNYITPAGIDEIKKILCQLDVMVEVYVKGSAYIERSYYRKVKEKKIVYRDRDYVLSTRVPVLGVKNLLDVHRYRIEKVALYFKNNKNRNEIWEQVKNIRNVHVTSSGSNNIEFMGESCSKADTLRILCSRLGIPMSETMAAGDSLNDMDMLEAAGFSVAMGNAEECVKQCADYITSDNYCDGLAKAIEHKLFHII